MSKWLEEADYSGRFEWRLWLKVLRRVLGYKRYVIPLAVMALAVAWIDAAFPLVTRDALNLIERDGARADLRGCIQRYVVLTVSLGISVWIFIVLAGKITTQLSHDLRQAGFARLQALSFSYFDRRPVGWLIARMTSDSARLADFVAWGLLEVFWCTGLMGFVAFHLLRLEPRLGLITLSVVPLLALACWYFRRIILRSSREIRKQNSLLTAAYNEGISGVRTTKTLVREAEHLSEFRETSSTMFRASVHNAIQSALLWPVVLTLGSVGTGLALYYGGGSVLAGTIRLGTLVAFMHYTGRFFEPVQQMANVLTQSQRAQASAERLLDLLETVPEVRDAPGVAAIVKRRKREKPDDGMAEDGYPDRIGTVEFRNVCFAYQGGKPVLERFNMTVPAGTTVALVGPTGGGKSTIVSLLCRFYEPTAGEILIDGIDYRKRSLHWLQSNLGIVLQTPHLFSGTVRENIRYARLDATDEEIECAARLVNAHPFIAVLEKGYDTHVGQAGNRLSTGQKQLISFARAVLADPQIFVMDEATSSIDTETERRIQQGVEAILAGRMSFVIAHRLSTIRHADVIMVVEDGRILERGNHRDLLTKRGKYYELYTRQFVEEAETHVLAQMPGSSISI